MDDLHIVRYRGEAALLSLKDGNACRLHAPLGHAYTAVAYPALHISVNHCIAMWSVLVRRHVKTAQV